MNDFESPDDVDRWEGMYTNENNQGGFDKKESIQHAVRVVTFDLDNTIWKTGAVIDSANDALAKFLQNKDIICETRVEKVMGEIFIQNKSEYCPVLASDLKKDEKYDGVEYWEKVKAPVLLTKLRKDAVRKVLTNQSVQVMNELQLVHFVEEAFQIWTDARHDAIPSNFASSVLEVLEDIRRLQTESGERIVVGAVTDGNSNPLKIEVLKEYFDFVVNAEGVGISKPDKRIYDAAILEIVSDPSLNHVFDIDLKNNIDTILDQSFNWWVHVGDDFVKDIVATKDLGMRSIWCRELIMDKLPKEEIKQKPKTDLVEFKKNVADQAILKMSIGAEDYLMEALHDEFADAIVDDFRDVAKVISAWHGEGTRQLCEETQLPDYFSIVLPDDKTLVPGTSTIPVKELGDSTIAQETASKYCIECGERILCVAKFCPACGKKQPFLD